ncbi:MAG: tripartite tricarboxylate transporter TctB family protein [Betaproteobacteria bacterium]|nr:tripartite tricarboxylate transporter TctB family protein [Betaproteobacteria bacterium]
MKTRFLDNQDFLAGLLFIAIGAGGFGIALSYPFGSVQHMGPGFFPRVLGGILVGFGIVTLVRGLRSGEPVQGEWGWYPLVMLTASLVAFGWLMEHVGLVASLVVLIVSSAYAGREFRWGEVAVLAVAMTLLALVIFVWGLGLPYELFAFEFGE